MNHNSATDTRGRLLGAQDLSNEVFNGQVTADWITRYLKVGKVKLGHVTVAWWEGVVRDWVKSIPFTTSQEG